MSETEYHRLDAAMFSACRDCVVLERKRTANPCSCVIEQARITASVERRCSRLQLQLESARQRANIPPR